MNRLFLIAAASSAALLCGGFLFSLFMFSQNMNRIEESEKEFTRKTAHYIEAYFEKESFTVELSLDPDHPSKSPMDIRNEWVRSFSEAAGFSDIVIADSIGLVLASTDQEFSSGSWILASRRDSLFVDSCLSGKNEVWSEQKNSRGLKSRFLYKIIHIDREPHVLILGARQDILSETDTFKRNAAVSGSAFSVVLVILFLLLNYYVRAAEKAQHELRRRDKLSFLGRMSAELAHELKNPLAVIKSSSEALMRDPDSRRKQLLLTFISEECSKMSRLISGMLSLGKERSASMVLFSPAEAVKPITDPLAELHPHCTVQCELSPDLKILGDPELFAQIAENLLSNAVRETSSEGSVSVQAEERSDAVLLRFLDNGAGVPSEMRDTLFDPFVSGSKNGTGLGLSIVKNSCEKMGWQIRHTDCTSDGWRTCFEITIPRRAE